MNRTATIILLSGLLALGAGAASADDKPRRGYDRDDRAAVHHGWRDRKAARRAARHAHRHDHRRADRRYVRAHRHADRIDYRAARLHHRRAHRYGYAHRHGPYRAYSHRHYHGHALTLEELIVYEALRELFD